jgi:sodium/pantothenate symporter
MLLATGLLFFIILEKGNGMENIMQSILKTNPNLLTPDSNGAVSKPFILSFWMLVGVGVLGLPVTEVRCMGFKDSKAMHRAMIIGTSIVGILMLGMHLVGVMGAAVEPGVEVGDKIIPILAIKNMHPILAGVFIAGPLAAIMSSVDSLLIMSSAAIVKDLYINYIDKNPSESKIKKLSFATSLLLGIIVFVLALNPPKLLVWINLFALAGQEAAFFCPILLGLYWKRANATGAAVSMIFSVVFYLYTVIMNIKIMNMHQIVPTIIFSILLFTIGSYFGKPNSEKVNELFFSEK